MVYSASPLEATATDIASQPVWVVGLHRNDPATIRALYAKHFPAIKHYVLQNSGTGNDAQDMFQEAMTVLWMSVKEGRFVPDAEPGGFLYRVAKNKWLDVVRSAAHKHMKVVHDDRALDHRIDAPDDIEERIVRLRGVYDTLDDKCRMVLDQFYFERKDLATIAAGMGVEEESIRTIKYRCMMKLRGFRKAISGEDMEEA
ncbi:MAG: sigma-70 family RNA polymerase sigma factor [Flavobacteriales bacterium]|nr:sigma-70 family RNA polymerase sigma factor [Flavobacteriales bacterium]